MSLSRRGIIQYFIHHKNGIGIAILNDQYWRNVRVNIMKGILQINNFNNAEALASILFFSVYVALH